MLTSVCSDGWVDGPGSCSESTALPGIGLRGFAGSRSMGCGQSDMLSVGSWGLKLLLSLFLLFPYTGSSPSASVVNIKAVVLVPPFSSKWSISFPC